MPLSYHIISYHESKRCRKIDESPWSSMYVLIVFEWFQCHRKQASNESLQRVPIFDDDSILECSITFDCILRAPQAHSLADLIEWVWCHDNSCFSRFGSTLARKQSGDNNKRQKTGLAAPPRTPWWWHDCVVFICMKSSSFGETVLHSRLLERELIVLEDTGGKGYLLYYTVL